MLLGNTHRFAGFAVLKAPDVASVLVEMGYISSSTDEALLSSSSHRKQLARAVRRRSRTISTGRSCAAHREPRQLNRQAVGQQSCVRAG